jgi:uroporphyrinogen-III synthase
MRVLVTRPAISAGRTGQRLAALGHEPLLLPLFRAEHDAAGVALARAAKDIGSIIVTSAEAIRALGRAEELAGIPVFAVGQKTAKAALDAGFSAVETAGADGAALARYLCRRFPDGTGPNLLYLTGEPRTPQLEQTLVAARFRIMPAVCYRMQPVDIAGDELQSLFQTAPDAVLLYSSETARRFFDAAGSVVRQHEEMKILCLSAAVAEAVPAEIRNPVRWAATPDEDALFELL